MSVFSLSFVVFSILFIFSVKPLCSIVLLPFSAILTNPFCLFFMYPTLLYYCLLLNLFVICFYLCLFNPIWGCYVPGGTHTQWWYSIRVCIILLCPYYVLLVLRASITFNAMMCQKCTKIQKIRLFRKQLFVWS